MDINTLRSQLDNLNQELSHLTGLDPPNLAFQSGTSEEDSLFLYGIVGGKDVGKTSLINQLAGAKISNDTDILDEGTRIAVAYCHRDDLSVLKKRLASEIGERLAYVPHDHNELQNVVLIDFPDYDSRFIRHRNDVQRLNKYLQAIVWVISPRKYGDHEFMDQLEAVAQSSEYYYVVLNKVDQLENKADMDTIRKEIGDYLTHECRKRNVPPPAPDRLLLLSAIYPEKYEFHTLHDRLIRIHSQEEISKAKIKNLMAEFEKNLARLKEHYSIESKIEEIDQALEYIQTNIQKEFSEDYFDTVCQRILLLEQKNGRISSELFHRRVEAWPILRSLFYPLAGIVSVFGSRFAFSRPVSDFSEVPWDILRHQGSSASTRLQNIQEQVEEQYPQLAPHFDKNVPYSEVIDQSFTEIMQDHEERLTEQLSQESAFPSRLRKLIVFLPLIWFPFLQPLIYSLIQQEEGLLSFSSFYELFAVLISLFSASALLLNLVFLLILYTIWLVFMYSQGARMAMKENREEFINTWYGQFIPGLTDLLSRPLQEIRSKLVEKSVQIQNISQELKNQLEKLATTQ